MNLEFGKYYTMAMLNKDPNYSLPQEEVLVQNGGFSGHAMFFSTPRRYDFRPYLQQISSPVMIIRGANDLFAKGVSEEYHSLLPQSVYTVFEDSTHFPYREEPENFALTITDFFNN